MDRTKMLFNRLLEEHSSELILSALDEMARMNKLKLLPPVRICENESRVESAEDKNHLFN